MKWGWNARAALLMGAVWSGFMGLRFLFAGRARSPRGLLRSFAIGLVLIFAVAAVTVVVVPRSIRAEWEDNARAMCPGKLSAGLSPQPNHAPSMPALKLAGGGGEPSPATAATRGLPLLAA